MPLIHIDHLHLQITESVDQLLEEIRKMADQVQTVEGQITRLTADVANVLSVNQSAVTLLTGLAQQIRDLQNDPAQLSALADQIEASTAELAAAVTANTPADPGNLPPDTTGAAEGTTEPTGETGDTSGTGATQTDGTEAGADTATDPIDTTDAIPATTQSEDGASA